MKRFTMVLASSLLSVGLFSTPALASEGPDATTARAEEGAAESKDPALASESEPSEVSASIPMGQSFGKPVFQAGADSGGAGLGKPGADSNKMTAFDFLCFSRNGDPDDCACWWTEQTTCNPDDCFWICF